MIGRLKMVNDIEAVMVITISRTIAHISKANLIRTDHWKA